LEITRFLIKIQMFKHKFSVSSEVDLSLFFHSGYKTLDVCSYSIVGARSHVRAFSVNMFHKLGMTCLVPPKRIKSTSQPHNAFPSNTVVISALFEGFAYVVTIRDVGLGLSAHEKRFQMIAAWRVFEGTAASGRRGTAVSIHLLPRRSIQWLRWGFTIRRGLSRGRFLRLLIRAATSEGVANDVANGGSDGHASCRGRHLSHQPGGFSRRRGCWGRWRWRWRWRGSARGRRSGGRRW